MHHRVFFFLALIAAPIAAYADGGSPVLPAPGDVGVRVEKPAGDGVHFSQGSGVYLGDGLVLTAAHVIKFDPAHSAVTVLLDGVRTDGVVVFDGQMHDVDLALIKLAAGELSQRRRDQPPVPLCLDNPAPNQPVTVAALGTVSPATTIGSAITSDAKAVKGWTNILSTAFHQGNSGGGVFSPKQGCLWGIINLEMSGKLPDTGRFVDLTAFVPASKIAPFIGDYFAQETK